MGPEELQFTSGRQWRNWLARSHAEKTAGVWLVFHRKHSGKLTLDYEDAVEHALCFGWVDSLVRKLDEQRFARKFTPRKPHSQWSAANRKRVAKLIGNGLMTEHGMALVKAAQASGTWQQDSKPPHVSDSLHDAFDAALRKHPAARRYYEQLAPGQQRRYRIWINMAKRDDTRHRRIREAIALLAQHKPLGLK